MIESPFDLWEAVFRDHYRDDPAAWRIFVRLCGADPEQGRGSAFKALIDEAAAKTAEQKAAKTAPAYAHVAHWGMF